MTTSPTSMVFGRQLGDVAAEMWPAVAGDSAGGQLAARAGEEAAMWLHALAAMAGGAAVMAAERGQARGPGSGLLGRGGRAAPGA